MTELATVGRKAHVPAVVSRLLQAFAGTRSGVAMVNLHSVPARHEGAFDALLDRLSERYELARADMLEEALVGGIERPTLLLSFDDGLENHASVVAPILAAHGLTAIFALPVAFLDLPPEKQLPWFRRHVYPRSSELHRDEDVAALSWEQAAALARQGHRICSHGTNHVILGAGTAPATLRDEIEASRRRLEERLPGVEVTGFCWPVRFDAAAVAADGLVRKTYRYALCGGNRRLAREQDPFRIPRINLEVSWPAHVVDLQLARAFLR